MKILFLPRLLALGLAFAGTASVQADVKLHGLFTDGTVLQRDREVPVWGTGSDGEKVTVKFTDQEISTTVRDGRWMVKLKPLKAGGPFTLTVIAGNTVTVTNLLVGEVWLCSGQSNMGFQLSRAANAQEAIAAAGDPELRLFSVPHEATDEPLRDISGQWKTSTPETAASFSAVAYFFGRDLRRALKVPIGLIDSSVGGTPAEAWTSRETLENNPELKQILKRHDESVRAYDPAKAEENYRRELKKSSEAAKSADTANPPARKPSKAANPARASKRPGGLYNAMIAPLQPYALAGAIWYQGEANSGRAAEYQTLFPALIQNWRQAWGQGEFPFLFVQIAPNARMTPEIREAQLRTWQKVPRTAMVVSADIGEANDIHPKKKEPVGARLALAARAIAYNEKIEYSGPVFDRLTIAENRAILSFTHTGSGIVAKGETLKGFTIAGADKKFVPADWKIIGFALEVSSKEVPNPVAVRYGWDNVPDINLFNKEGLPATPFRTDP
jgi:sialate O-acetylesterase